MTNDPDNGSKQDRDGEEKKSDSMSEADRANGEGQPTTDDEV